MRLILSLIVFLCLQPNGQLYAADDASPETSSKMTSEAEAQYQACLKEAHDLQKKYVDCTTDACRAEFKKEFNTWSNKCFKAQ
jgi:hypothetical protein